MKKAILFDLDGTLWDTVYQVTLGFNRALARHPELNKQIDEAELRSYMGLNRVDVAARMLPMVDAVRGNELMDECFAAEEEVLREIPGTVYPHAVEVLEQLSRRYTLGIISNCQTGYIEQFMATAGVEQFIADHECFTTGLPKGENIKLVLERNGIDRAIYVGDTQGDLNAADLAGIPFVHAAYGFGTPNRQTERIDSLAELPSLAEKLLK